MRYRQKHSYTWSNETAYAVGLMASDGCLLSDGRHLDLTSKDFSQLENFVEAISRDLPITSKKGNLDRQYYRVQFSDVAFYDFLLSVGLTPNKSKTIAELKVPDRYYGHFLRGFFDGDGSTYGYHDPRWPKSFLFYTAFSCASPRFLEYLHRTNKRLYNLERGSVRWSNHAYVLVYGKADSSKLYTAMYRNSGSLFLTRKRFKTEGFIKEAKNGRILPVIRASGEIGKHATLRG